MGGKRVSFAILALMISVDASVAMWIAHDQEVVFRLGERSGFDSPVLSRETDAIRSLGVHYLMASRLLSSPTSEIYVGFSGEYAAPEAEPLDGFSIPSGGTPEETDWRYQPSYYAVCATARYVRNLLTEYTEIFADVSAGLGEGTAFQAYGDVESDFPFVRGTYFRGWSSLWKVGAGVSLRVPFLDTAGYPDFPIQVGVEHTWMGVDDRISDPDDAIGDAGSDMDFSGTHFYIGTGLRF